MSPENAHWSLLHIESKTQLDSLTYVQAAALASSFSKSEWSNWAAWYEGLADWQTLEDLLGVLNVRRTQTAPRHSPPEHHFENGIAQQTYSNVRLTPETRSYITMPNLQRAVAGELPLEPLDHAAETVVTQSGAHVLEPTGSEPPLGFVSSPSLKKQNSEPAFASASQPSIRTDAGARPLTTEHAAAQAVAPTTQQPDARLSRRFLKRYKAVIIMPKGKVFETQTVDLSLTGVQVVDSVPFGSDGPFEVILVNSKNEQLQLIASLITDQKRTRLQIMRAAKLDQLHAWLLNPGQ